MVYDDGLMLSWRNQRSGDGSGQPIFQRKLSPDGIDLLRRTGASFPTLSGKGASFPSLSEDMWADAEERVWMPSEYAACPTDPYAPLPLPTLGQFPDPVQALLAGTQRTYQGDADSGPWGEPYILECFALTLEDVYTLLDPGANPSLPTDYNETDLFWSGRSDIVDIELTDGETVSLDVWPVLPHGEFVPDFVG
jgi:hypothetical protein